MSNVSKTIRVTGDQLTHVHALMAHFPEIRSEAEMLTVMFQDGLLVRAAQANLPGAGTPLYGGYDARTLAALLERRLLPVIAFLLDHGALRHFLLTPVQTKNEQPSETINLGAGAPFDPEASRELEEFGSDLL